MEAVHSVFSHAGIVIGFVHPWILTHEAIGGHKEPLDEAVLLHSLKTKPRARGVEGASGTIFRGNVLFIETEEAVGKSLFLFLLNLPRTAKRMSKENTKG